MNTEIYTLSLHDALPIFLVDLVVDTLLESAGDLGEVLVPAGAVGDRAGDDQRGPGLVDEDRVDLVVDGVMVASLDTVLGLRRHVVGRVVEAGVGGGSVGECG